MPPALLFSLKIALITQILLCFCISIRTVFSISLKNAIGIFLVPVQLGSCVRLFCDPMNCSTPGFLVLHYLPELAQTHVH